MGITNEIQRCTKFGPCHSVFSFGKEIMECGDRFPDNIFLGIKIQSQMKRVRKESHDITERLGDKVVGEIQSDECKVMHLEKNKPKYVHTVIASKLAITTQRRDFYYG